MLWAVLALAVFPCRGQELPDVLSSSSGEDVPAELSGTANTPSSPAPVEVQPLADDQAIAARLTRILEATQWFTAARVEVDEGVVFLYGTTDRDEYKEWANQLALRTRDVVAVVNRIDIAPRSIWDFSPAIAEMRALAEGLVRWLPLLVIGCVLLILTWFAARLAARLARRILAGRLSNDILRQVAASLVAIPVFLLGLYFVLRILTLTRLAVTVLGGTGIAGLIIGIAFRDIAENYLASILLSTHSPFRAGDLIEVAGKKGFVQRVTTRGTLLMTLEGFYIQIPNSIVYKETLVNLTSNPNMRQDFTIGIGYDTRIPHAQQVAMRVLADHPAVLNDPEPLVLVEQLGAATVLLHIYFWMNGHEHSVLKVKSSVIRLTKRAFEDASISMPDEAREVIFPRPVHVRLLPENGPEPTTPREGAQQMGEEPQEPVTSSSEGGLDTERKTIDELARSAIPPDTGTDLLKP